MTKNALAIHGNRAPYLTSTSFPLFPFHRLTPPILLSYIVINKTTSLSSVMCLNVQGGNKEILSLSSAGFDSAFHSNTHFRHTLCFVRECVCISVIDKERFVRAAELMLPLDTET